LSLADCPIPRAYYILPTRLVLQSPPLLWQSVFEVLRSLGMMVKTEVDRFHDDTGVPGQEAEFSVRSPNL